MASENWLTDDFYKALGVSEDASSPASTTRT